MKALFSIGQEVAIYSESVMKSIVSRYPQYWQCLRPPRSQQLGKKYKIEAVYYDYNRVPGYKFEGINEIWDENLLELVPPTPTKIKFNTEEDHCLDKEI